MIKITGATEKDAQLMQAAWFLLPTVRGAENWTVEVSYDKEMPEGVSGVTCSNVRPGLIVPMHLKPDYVGGGDGPYTREEIVAHEMVHVHQIVRGELKYMGNHLLWNNKPWSGTMVQIMCMIDERALPWETEAYGRMERMAEAMPDVIAGWEAR